MLLRSCRQLAPFGGKRASWVTDDAGGREAGTPELGGVDEAGGAALAVWPAGAAPLAMLHDDVIDQVLSPLSPEELLAVALVCSRLRGLALSDRHWAPAFAARWALAPLSSAAAALAGSWRALYASKAAVDGASGPWRRPCEWELRAALDAMVADVMGAPSSGAAPERRAAGGIAAAHAGDEDADGGADSAGPASELAVCFLIDGSGSVGEDDFDSMTTFAATAATSFAESVPGAKISVLQFSNTVRVEVDLAPLGDPAAFAERTSKMVRMNGGTSIAAALAQAGAMLKASAAPGAARLVVLLTDGRVDAYQSREAKDMAARMADEQAGVRMWALGVGRGVDRQELVKILEGADPLGAAGRYIDLCVRDDAPW